MNTNHQSVWQWIWGCIVIYLKALVGAIFVMLFVYFVAFVLGMLFGVASTIPGL
jgi:ABC-type multidrug transport system permease subunit